MVVDFLSEVMIFKGLKKNEINDIAKIYQKAVYVDGSQILNAGDNATTLYIVSSGEVKLKFTIALINEPIDLTIDIMKKGDFFGWSSFAEPYRYTASAYAVGDTELIQIRADEMKELCNASDHLGRILMNNITTIVSERFSRLEGLLKHVIQTGVNKP
jgi:CRP/FNR family transcriptional regulator